MTPTTRSRASALAPPLLVFFAAAAVLLFVGRRVDRSAIFINGLGGSMNDQIGNISVARNLADNGRMQNSAVFPSTLAQKGTKNCFYMPGQFVVLATSFRLFGYSPRAAFLPALLSFVLSAVLTFFIAARLYGPGTGLAAAALFILFPVNAILAWSAMSELTVTFATLIALSAFLILPDRAKPFVGPLLVVIPLLVRETGVIVAVPMCMMILHPLGANARARWGAATTFAALTIAAVLLVLSSNIARGRPSLFLNNLAARSISAIYTDAYSMESVDRSPANLQRLFIAKFKRNVTLLAAPLRRSGGPTHSDEGERLAMWFILAVVPVSLAAWLFRRDAFAAGVGVAVVIGLALVLLTYTVWSYRGVRVLLLAQPLAAIVYASLLAPSFGRWRWATSVPVAALVCLLVLQGIPYVNSVFAPEQELNANDALDERFVESVGHDDRRMIVTPHTIIMRYFTEHHPVRWSFIPANLRTFRLLEQKYDIGTIIYPVRAPECVSLPELEQEGFRVVDRRKHLEQEFVILRRD